MKTKTKRLPKGLWEKHERASWLPPPEETIDAWAERSLVLPRIVSSTPGPLSLDLIPFIREPLRSATDSDVEEITLCCSTQVMKTTYLIIVALHTIAVDPWNCMHVMTTDGEAEDLNVERYQPIIRESPALAQLLSGQKHDTCRDALRLNGCTVNFRGAHSPSGLASRPVARLFLDEVDKWPEWSGVEADPIKLARERTRTFWNRKIVNASTPTTAQRYIWPRLQESTNERYWMPCPHCHGFQRFVMGGRESGPGIKWPEGTTAELIQRDRLAWYECEHCRGRILDQHKPAMLRKGLWCPESQRVAPDGTIAGTPPPRRHVGYHLWAAYSPWLTFSEIAAEFLRSKDSQSALMNFRNSWQAEPWAIVVGELKKNQIKDRIIPYKQGATPPAAWILTVGVDVQEVGGRTYQYYVIRAWGREGESWLFRAGISPDWQNMARILLHSQYRSQDGSPLSIGAVLVDSGFDTKAVYTFCEAYGCIASKGVDGLKKDFDLKEAEVVEGDGHWLRRVNFEPTRFKRHVHNLIREDRWHLPEDLPEEYFDHMLAEQLTSVPNKKTGRTQYQWRVQSSRPNHYFDCEVMTLVGADILDLRFLKDPPKQQPPPEARAKSATGLWEPAQRIVSKVFG